MERKDWKRKLVLTLANSAIDGFSISSLNIYALLTTKFPIYPAFLAIFLLFSYIFVSMRI